MAKILNIETSTRVCSVSLSVDGKVVKIKESRVKNSHAEQVTLFTEEVVKKAGMQLTDIDAVAVSKGPGSYTGLRIGVSTAKGLCFAIDKPLISIGTLDAMAWGLVNALENKKQLVNAYLYCPMIDARRMEVYDAVYRSDLSKLKEVSATILEEDTYSGFLETHPMIFGGDGAEKAKGLLFKRYPKAYFLDGFEPSSMYMAELAEKKYDNNDFEDVAYFEPFYLKDFIAGISKVKGLK
jgi:tRNA threonylcarbamoyladenosine biosynthesis protein TsaB